MQAIRKIYSAQQNFNPQSISDKTPEKFLKVLKKCFPGIFDSFQTPAAPHQIQESLRKVEITSEQLKSLTQAVPDEFIDELVPFFFQNSSTKSDERRELLIPVFQRLIMYESLSRIKNLMMGAFLLNIYASHYPTLYEFQKIFLKEVTNDGNIQNVANIARQILNFEDRHYFTNTMLDLTKKKISKSPPNIYLKYLKALSQANMLEGLEAAYTINKESLRDAALVSVVDGTLEANKYSDAVIAAKRSSDVKKRDRLIESIVNKAIEANKYSKALKAAKHLWNVEKRDRSITSIVHKAIEANEYSDAVQAVKQIGDEELRDNTHIFIVNSILAKPHDAWLSGLQTSYPNGIYAPATKIAMQIQDSVKRNAILAVIVQEIIDNNLLGSNFWEHFYDRSDFAIKVIEKITDSNVMKETVTSAVNKLLEGNAHHYAMKIAIQAPLSEKDAILQNVAYKSMKAGEYLNALETSDKIPDQDIKQAIFVAIVPMLIKSNRFLLAECVAEQKVKDSAKSREMLSEIERRTIERDTHLLSEIDQALNAGEFRKADQISGDISDHEKYRAVQLSIIAAALKADAYSDAIWATRAIPPGDIIRDDLFKRIANQALKAGKPSIAEEALRGIFTHTKQESMSLLTQECSA